MTEGPTWVIPDAELRTLVHRAHTGEEPNALMAELYASSVIEDLASTGAEHLLSQPEGEG